MTSRNGKKIDVCKTPGSSVVAGKPAGSKKRRPRRPGSRANVYRKISDRSRFYITQKKSYTCGPTTIAMAIADHVTGKLSSDADVKALTSETGTQPSDGMPEWSEVLPEVGPKHGLKVKTYVMSVGEKTGMDTLDAELLQGHSAIVHVNNPRTKSGNGHFIYVAGITEDGGYVIGNPDGPANKALGHDQPVPRQAVENMMLNPPPSHPKTYKGTPGFTAVW
jgi:Peptidase_C39 like family